MAWESNLLPLRLPARRQANEVESRNMQIFLIGVACVGKTTIGANLADLLGYKFFDLDHEIEAFFGTSIERLQNQHLTSYSFRAEASQALRHLLARKDSANSVTALPPSGLMDNYWKVIKKTPQSAIVVLQDTPQNILKRITFYDIDSRQIQRELTDRDKFLYLEEIRRDIAYYRRSYKRAHIVVDIAGWSPGEASLSIKDLLMRAPGPLHRTGAQGCSALL
jgi:shikimate kinase